MKSHLILVRHSLPEIDFVVSSHEWHLSAEGRRRCERLADALTNYDPVAIVSSEEPKAVETAEIVAARFGVRVEVEPDLHEHDRRGQHQESISQAKRDDMTEHGAHPRGSSAVSLPVRFHLLQLGGLGRVARSRSRICQQGHPGQHPLFETPITIVQFNPDR